MGTPSAERLELLTALLRERGGRAPGQPGTIPRRKGSERVPLAFNQEGLWFLEQAEPGLALYNVPAITRLRGRLNVVTLEQSLTEIVRRHESLRTTIPIADGQPFQLIADPAPVKLPVTDLGTLPEPEREQEAVRLASDEVLRPFDLVQGPLFRAVLLRLREDEHVLVMTLHHIVADGWSMGVFTRELTTCYEALVSGTPMALAEPPIQYADFTLWQRARLQGGLLGAEIAYWRQKLDRLTTLALPADRPRPPVQSPRGAHEPVKLSALLTGALRRLAQREGATLFMILLAAFKVLLYRYTAQTDIVVGSTFANRSPCELEGLVGFFANTLPLRTDLSGNPSFREVLRRVREVALATFAHQEVPLTMLVKELRPERDPSRHPLYQVVFDLLTPDHNPVVYGYGLSSHGTQTLALTGLTLSPVDVEYGVARFDLTALLWDLPGGLCGSIEYSTDLFDALRIRRMLDQFETLLDHIAADPDVRLYTLRERLEDAERREQIRGARALKESMHRKLREMTRSVPGPH